MKSKHNILRYGELYDQVHIKDQLEELEKIKNLIILSGGWAWHFISPEHKEYKHLHDHKDIDIFVRPVDFLMVRTILEDNEFHRIKTKYDNNNFIRYGKIKNNKKIIIDMFKYDKKIPYVTARENFVVVEPKYLLTLYKTIHQTQNCISIQNCLELIESNEEILNNSKMIKFL